jgi:glycosyltransferase involved in cell wall biosynthesis
MNDSSIQPCSVEIVVPSFDEGDELRLAVERIVQTLSESGIADFLLTIVVDGPMQKTVNAASLVADPRVKVHVLPMNMGKGYAIRTGLAGSSAEVVGFIDGDLDISPTALVDAIHLLKSDNAENVGCVYGSKFHIGSSLSYPASRRFASRVFRLVVTLLFDLYVDDTQTGIKVFRRKAIFDSLEDVSQNGFLFDIELMTAVQRAGFQLVSVPVQINYQYSSSIRFATAMKIFYQTIFLSLSIRRRCSSRHERSAM